jgi:hypothetical protein
VVALRPLGVDDLFTGSFATIRGYWRPLLAVSGSVAAVMALLGIPLLVSAEPAARALIDLVTLDPNASTAEASAAFSDFTDAVVDLAPLLIVLFLLQSISAVVVEAGSAVVVGRAVLGKPVSSREVLRRVVRLLPRLLLLGLVMGATIGLGVLLCVIPGLLMFMLWFAAPSAAVLEDAPAFGALRRSAQLMSKSFWRVIGLLLLVQIVYGLVFQVISVPVSFLTSVGAFGAASDTVASGGAITLLVLGYYALALVGLVTYPLVAVARTIEYLDLRMRHEGLADTLVAEAKSGSQQ